MSASAGQIAPAPRTPLPWPQLDPRASRLDRESHVDARRRTRGGRRLSVGDRSHRSATDRIGCGARQDRRDRSVSGAGRLVAVLPGPSPGTSPRYAIKAGAEANRRKSCSSARINIAVNVSMPSRIRLRGGEHATGSRVGSIGRASCGRSIGAGACLKNARDPRSRTADVQAKREAVREWIAEIDPEPVVFVDESGAKLIQTSLR